MTPANALANALVNVLVVDDEPLARRRLVRHLRQLPWVAQVEEDADVRQAMEDLARFDEHILLLDIQMPGGSGFDLVALVEQEPGEYPHSGAYLDHRQPLVFVKGGRNPVSHRQVGEEMLAKRFFRTYIH